MHFLIYAKNDLKFFLKNIIIFSLPLFFSLE